MEKKSTRASTTLRSAFLCGAATISLGAALAPAAYAQGGALETVVVTGTSIRGAAPTGSNVIAVDREQMEATGATTMQELYTTIPAISSFGVSSKPSEGIVGIESQPTIHNFGESSSLSTLILMNGRPMMPQGSLLAGDPSVIPGIAIQRVDVMPDGDSAVYGSSAVAGVVNFITRKGFEGLETSASFGRAQGYNRANIGLIAGHSWDTGSVTFAYEYKSNSSLYQRERAFGASADLRPNGGGNFNTVNCSPADISTSNTATIFLYPYNNPAIGTPATLTSTNANPCDESQNLQYFPSRETHTTYLDIQQDIGKVQIDFNAGYNYRASASKSTTGAVTGTAFGPTGSSAAEGTLSRNPFYVSNATTGTTSEFIRFDTVPLLGNTVSHQGAQDVYENLAVTIPIIGDWVGEVDQTASFANDFTNNLGGFCATCALLALNGTTNSGATANNSVATTAVSDPFTLPNIVSVTRALTTSDALDVWNPAATNRTSPQVLKEIMSDQSQSSNRVNMNDIKVKFDGPLFDLPAGSLKAAFGVEFQQVNDDSYSSGSNGTGSSLQGGTNNNQALPQVVRSAYLEFAIPVISPEMNIPLMQKLDLQVAGRMDDYSTTGTTRNPKLGVTWQVVDGLRARGSFGTSFTAPNVTFVSGVNSISTSNTAFTIPSTHINYPGSFCTGPGAPNPCNTGGSFPGLSLSGPNPALQPMRGINWSAGVDIIGSQLWAPLSGFTMALTYWNTLFKNGIQLVSNIGAGYVTTPGLMQYLQIAPPGGWTATSPIIAADIAAYRSSGPLPPTIYFIEQRIRVNGFNILGDGADASIHYNYSAGDLGDFSLGYDVSAKFDWKLKGGPSNSSNPVVSYLNGRFNTSVIYAAAYEARASAGWALDPISVSFFWNYTAPYWWQTSTGTFANSPMGIPSNFPTNLYNGGFQRVKPNNTFDLDVGLKLPDTWLDGWTKGTKLGLNVRDLFDTRPPFFNGGGTCSGSTFCNALDEFNGDSLERVITFSIRKTF